jgi:hypothetical protein
MNAILVALMTTVLCLPAGPGHAAEARLEGVVQNGTEGKGVPDDLEVEVVQTSSTGSEVARATSHCACKTPAERW